MLPPETLSMPLIPGTYLDASAAVARCSAAAQPVAAIINRAHGDSAPMWAQRSCFNRSKANKATPGPSGRRKRIGTLKGKCIAGIVLLFLTESRIGVLKQKFC